MKMVLMFIFSVLSINLLWMNVEANSDNNKANIKQGNETQSKLLKIITKPTNDVTLPPVNKKSGISREAAKLYLIRDEFNKTKYILRDNILEETTDNCHERDPTKLTYNNGCYDIYTVWEINSNGKAVKLGKKTDDNDGPPVSEATDGNERPSHHPPEHFPTTIRSTGSIKVTSTSPRPINISKLPEAQTATSNTPKSPLAPSDISITTALPTAHTSKVPAEQTKPPGTSTSVAVPSAKTKTPGASTIPPGETTKQAGVTSKPPEETTKPPGETTKPSDDKTVMPAETKKPPGTTAAATSSPAGTTSATSDTKISTELPGSSTGPPAASSVPSDPSSAAAESSTPEASK